MPLSGMPKPAQLALSKYIQPKQGQFGSPISGPDPLPPQSIPPLPSGSRQLTPRDPSQGAVGLPDGPMKPPQKFPSSAPSSDMNADLIADKMAQSREQESAMEGMLGDLGTGSSGSQESQSGKMSIQEPKHALNRKKFMFGSPVGKKF